MCFSQKKGLNSDGCENSNRRSKRPKTQLFFMGGNFIRDAQELSGKTDKELKALCKEPLRYLPSVK